MTVEVFTPHQMQIVQGVGPYSMASPALSAEDVRVLIYAASGEPLLLDPSAYTVTLSHSGVNVVLTQGIADTYAGSLLWINRATVIEQGWAALQNSRELGLQAQLDRLTKGLQEVAHDVNRAVRASVASLPFIPAPGITLTFDEHGQPVRGPSLNEISNAQAFANLSRRYATEDEEVVVQDGEFSSRHHALKAAADAADVAAALAAIGGATVGTREVFTGDGTANPLTLALEPINLTNVMVFVDATHQSSLSLSGRDISPVGFVWPLGSHIEVRYFTPINLAEWEELQAALATAEASATLAVSAYQGRQYATRAEAVADVDYDPAPGTVITAGGLQYVRSAGATALPGLPGWLPFGETFLEHFGGSVSLPTAPVMNDDAMDAATAYIEEYKLEKLRFRKGYYFFERPHVLPRHCVYEGSGNIPMQRFGAASSLYVDNYAGYNHTNWIVCGVGAKERSIKFVTDGRQLGFNHTLTTGRNYTNTVDAEFALDDYTNRNASNATPATSRLFSAAISFQEGFGRAVLKNMRVIPSCPAAGEVQGLGGYGISSEVLPWADWDIGVFINNPWGCYLENMAVTGYWGRKALLSYGNFEETVISGLTPNAEHGYYSHCQFQSGIAFRDTDMWAVADKTSAVIYLRWTPSHQFSPTGGTVRISETDTLTGPVYEYGSTSYTPNPTPNGVSDHLGDGWILLRDVRPLGAGANNTSAIRTIHTHPTGCSKVNPGFAGGHSHTLLSNCTLTDFAHATGIDEASPALVGAGIPLRTKYSCAMEISGAPMRAVKLLNTTMTTSGPLVVHAGMARELTLIGDNYAETRPYRTVIGEVLSGNRGAVFLAGASSLFRAEAGLGAAFSLAVWGGQFNDIVGLHPFKVARSGTRMAAQEDYFHAALGAFSLSEAFPLNIANQLQMFGGAEQEVRIGRRNAAGAEQNYILLRGAAGEERLDLLPGGQITLLKDIGIRPGTNTSYTLGQPSFRWLDVYAQRIRPGVSSTAFLTAGSGSPEGGVTAPKGSIYMRSDGGAGTSVYIKESGTGNTGWVAK